MAPLQSGSPPSLKSGRHKDGWDPLSDELESEVRLRARDRDRRLVRAAVSGGLVKIVVAVIALLSVAISARSLGTVQFGVATTLATITGLMTFADFGIGSGLMTYLAANGRGDLSDSRPLVSTAFFGMLLLGALLGAAGALSPQFVPWTDLLGAQPGERDSVNLAVSVFFVSCGVAVPASIGQRILFSLQRGLTANAWLLAGALAGLGATAGVAIMGGPLWAFILATLGGPILVAATSTVVLFSRQVAELRPRLRLVNAGSVKMLLSVSALFFALNIAVTIAFQSDALVVASQLGALSAAIFATTLRLFSLISTTVAMASQQMWSAMAEAISHGDHGWVKSRFMHVFVLTLATTSAASICVIVVAKPLIRIWVGDVYVPSTGLLIAFSVWTVYAAMMAQVGLFLNASNVVAPQVLMAALMTPVNLGLSLWLVHRVGFAGPIVASLISHAFCTGIPSLLLVRKKMRGLPVSNRNPESIVTITSGGV